MKIYLVSRECGDYSGHTYVIGAFDSQEKAQNCIDKKKQQFLINRKLRNSYQDFWKNYEAGKAAPTLVGLKTLPKWKSGLKKEEITAEMRAERQAIKDYNDQLIKEHELVHNNHYAELDTAALEYLTKEYPEINQKLIILTIDSNLDCDWDDSKFLIEEIELE